MPPTTLASAASMPAITITQSASRSAGATERMRSRPATPQSSCSSTCRAAQLGADARLVRGRRVRGAGRDDRDAAGGRERRDRDPGAARALVLERAGVDAPHRGARGLVGARHEHRARAAVAQRAHDRLDLGGRLALGEHRLGRPLPRVALQVDLREAEVGEAHALTAPAPAASDEPCDTSAAARTTSAPSRSTPSSSSRNSGTQMLSDGDGAAVRVEHARADAADVVAEAAAVDREAARAHALELGGEPLEARDRGRRRPRQRVRQQRAHALERQQRELREAARDAVRGRALAHGADRAHRLRRTSPARRRPRRRRRARSAARSRPSRRAAPPWRAAPRGGRRSSCARRSPAAGSAARGGRSNPGSARRSRAPAACARGGTPWPWRSPCGWRARSRRAARCGPAPRAGAAPGRPRRARFPQLSPRREDSAFRRAAPVYHPGTWRPGPVRASRRPVTSAARRCASRTTRCCAARGGSSTTSIRCRTRAARRSCARPFAHARIGAIDASAALALPGVIGVVTGADVAAHSRPFASALGPAIVHHAAAVDVARYVGEPVCVVVARDRYIAEDARRARARRLRAAARGGERRGGAGRGRAAAAPGARLQRRRATARSATAIPTRPSRAPRTSCASASAIRARRPRRSSATA